jgi:hypothetical protein
MSVVFDAKTAAWLEEGVRYSCSAAASI